MDTGLRQYDDELDVSVLTLNFVILAHARIHRDEVGFCKGSGKHGTSVDTGLCQYNGKSFGGAS